MTSRTDWHPRAVTPRLPERAGSGCDRSTWVLGWTDAECVYPVVAVDYGTCIEWMVYAGRGGLDCGGHEPDAWAVPPTEGWSEGTPPHDRVVLVVFSPEDNDNHAPPEWFLARYIKGAWHDRGELSGDWEPAEDGDEEPLCWIEINLPSEEGANK